jgi:alkylhydroperoxidase family enzyme
LPLDGSKGWRATIREPPRQYHDEEPEMPANPALTSETLSGALAPGGVMARDFNAVWGQLWRQDHVPPRLLELCRLRLAQLLGASAELDAPRGIERDPERIAALRSGSYHRSARFDAAEQAVLEFAEIYAQDPGALTDELADGVKRHFGEAGLVCLIEALGFIEGRIRLALMFTALGAATAH